MRYIIYGAGAVGSLLGGRLFQAGYDVLLVARGSHLRQVAEAGLRINDPQTSVSLPVPAVQRLEDAGIQGEDIVVLAMKTQDTSSALEGLVRVAPAETSILCAQNGIQNERSAQRRFRTVLGAYVYVAAELPAPGIVNCFTDRNSGVLDIGRIPAGRDGIAVSVSADFRSAGFDSVARADIMRWKYRKLVGNLLNALEAACGPRRAETSATFDSIHQRLQDEALAALDAAGIDAVSMGEQAARLESVLPFASVAGRPFPGGSSWQGFVRGSGSVEVDFLNGEIVLLGRMFGVSTPANEYLQRLVTRMATSGCAAGSVSVDFLYGELDSVIATKDRGCS